MKNARRRRYVVLGTRGRVFHRLLLCPPREPDVQLLQLAVQVRPLEPGLLGDAAHVALLATEQLLEVDALERLACLAQRKLEEARRDLRRNGLLG